ncbi:tyrosinase [Macrolepiota fuliginosa MF-IS2]|uniref:tyrosinase n=1 Tax=Macrolepiota fuliginosa MF-IS2 TaxID=1400762 RepID=A0A9P6C3F1_9AGAR|nr:tyrosinase [Macrolepiota fuliginosa MF-IS2]
MSLIATVGPTGGVKNRLDIVEFVKNEKFCTLYVRALQAIQAREQHAYESFFQLAGIHGLPFTEWAKERPSVDPYLAGYCTHGQVLFPTWHRTYVSIYEQILQHAAIEVAKKFTVNPKDWVQAALDLRQPYWDWGFQLVPPDQIIKQEQISIVNYDGKPISVSNPFLRYHFNPIDPSFRPYPDFNTWPTTIRNPNAQKQEDIPGLIAKMKIEAPQIRDKTYSMLKYNDSWELFSNHGVYDDAHANSLEAVHDDIHVIVGYGRIRGHMTQPLFAAFDPIFWLHHANVDRLLSLWQALNPDVWVTPGLNRDGTMGIAPNTEVTKTTPLEPFYETTSKVWTSVPLPDTTKLGYSYPDFNNLVGGDKKLIRDAIHDLIDRRYGHAKPKAASNAALNLLSSFHGVTEDHDKELQMYDWSIHVTFKKFELKDSFSLLFYFAINDGNYDKKDSYVGSINAFRGTTPENCANCKANENLVQEGFIHLNSYIAARTGSFEPKDVHEYLKKNKLSYKIFTDEENVTLTSLKIKVEGLPLRLPPGQTHPKIDRSHAPTIFEDVITYVAA